MTQFLQNYVVLFVLWKQILEISLTIINFAEGWDGILELPNHGLAICFDTEKVKFVGIS